MNKRWKYGLSGAAAGLVSGLFGGGGGTVLVPLLTGWCKTEQKRAFANCVAVIFPLCALSAVIYLLRTGLRLVTALPYLVGGLAGGFVGGKLFGKVSAPWLRRIFGLRRGAVPAVRGFFLPALVGFFTGILSAWGIGGGTLLLLVMTLFLGVDQLSAQGINLLYFLPTAAMALAEHKKNGLLEPSLLRSAIPWALPVTALAAWAATAVDVEALKKPFGVFLLVSGLYTVFSKPPKGK